MREPLTLSRTVTMHGPSVRPAGTKTTTRGPSLRGLDALAEPGSFGRRVALLAGLFILGLALGWLVTRPFVGRSNQPVTMSQYSTLVALLYQRDHNLNLAKERLGMFGAPVDLVNTASQDSKVTAPADQAALATLNQALTGGAAAATPSTQNTAESGNQAAAGIAGSQNTSSSSGHSSLLGPIVAFVLALVLGSIVLLRTAGLSASSLGLTSLSLGGLKGGERRQPRGTIRVEPVRPRADSTTHGRADDLPISASERAASSTRSGRPIVETRPIERSSSDRPTVDSRVNERGGERRSNSRGRIPSFQSAYHFGDDPYDEIHPITDPATGSLIAACGLSAALKHSGRGSAYFAFTAWLQNYADDEQLNAAGLVAPGSQDTAQEQIQGWVRGGQIDALVPIEKGMRADLGTGEISATVTILDAEFGDEPGAPRSYLNKLVVRFDVRA